MNILRKHTQIIQAHRNFGGNTQWKGSNIFGIRIKYFFLPWDSVLLSLTVSRAGAGSVGGGGGRAEVWSRRELLSRSDTI